MNDVLIGILLLVLGLIVCGFGLQVFFAALPIWGFIAGFFVGAAFVNGFGGEGFLSDALGVIAGIVVGIGFALASYFTWYLGAIMAAGSTGALLASGLLAAFGVGTSWVIFVVALIAAVAFAILAFVTALPVWVVLINTAIAGASAAVAGIMLLVDAIDPEQLAFGSAVAAIKESWFWFLLWAVIAAAGIWLQFRTLSAIVLPAERWVRARPTTARREPLPE